MEKKTAIALGIIVVVGGILFLIYQWMGNMVVGGGGVNQDVPDTAIAGQPTTLHLYASLTGGSASQNIDKVYPAATFFYRLNGENEYQPISGSKVSLPSNYQAVVSDSLNYKAFEFIIPSYPLSTMGKIEYYFELQTPGNPNGDTSRIEGIKNITVEAFDPMKNVDQPGLEIMD